MCGAGSAGAGAIMFVHNTLVEKYGITAEESAKLFYILDKDGLIGSKRANMEELRVNWPEIDMFAKDAALEGMQLEEVVQEVKPTILIGNVLK